MAEENDFYPMLFDGSPRSFVRSPQSYVYDHVSNQALPYSLPGLSEEPKPHGVPFQNQLEGTEEDLYSFNTGYQYPPTTLDPVIDTASSTSNIVNQTPPSSVFPSEGIPKEPKNTSTKPKKKIATIKSSLSLQKPVKVANPRQRSLERNRVAALKCRKRKKQWTEKLEQKKSGLEAIHTDLQGEYVKLFQESSQLKNHLINHAGCQDSNIDIWIWNEASKYVRNLHSPHGANGLCSVPTLDVRAANDTILEHGSTPPVSPTTSPFTRTQGSPGDSQDLNSKEFSDEDAFQADLEDLDVAHFDESEENEACSP